MDGCLDMSDLRTSLLSTNVFQEYPEAQPFIHDDYRRDRSKPVIAFPESNRKAVMSALQILQEKIHRLELEQRSASETRSDHDHPEIRPDHDHPSQSDQSKETRPTKRYDIRSKLELTEQRCHLLNEQLDQMRKMVQQAELDRSEAFRKLTFIKTGQNVTSNLDYRTQMDKLLELEREQLRLTATQTLAESKIRELEENLSEERRYRKMMQSRAAELEKEAVYVEECLESNEEAKNKQKKRKHRATSSTRKVVASRVVGKKYPPMASRSTTGSNEHYKLNLAEIPFINGKQPMNRDIYVLDVEEFTADISTELPCLGDLENPGQLPVQRYFESTGRSHSLSVNFQEVLSLMKSHNTKLCSKGRRSCSRSRKTKSSGRKVSPAVVVDRECSEDDNNNLDGFNLDPEDGLGDLLRQLQDEYAHMSFEYEELQRQISDASSQRIQDDLERELDRLVKRMEAKGEQIKKLGRYQTAAAKSNLHRSASAAASLPHRRPSSDSTNVEHVPSRGSSRQKIKSGATRSQSGIAPAKGSLNLLKDLKKIQSTLRTDDISWDC